MDTEEMYDKLYRYCYMKTKHQQTAEDITQETFLRFLESHSYKEIGKQTSYLYTIARNLCYDHFRKKTELPLEMKEEMLFADNTETQTTTIALEQTLQQLPEKEQELLFLRYTNGLSAAQAAAILNLSRFAVYRQEKKALKQLKKILDRRDFYDG
ncbi:MAG: sigma-70 family RNA polymerase sigma factor [Eubacteriales bacterium]|nr:sigma-70 family RNA polymerase sigma factor [Eubacteriales bacterium]